MTKKDATFHRYDLKGFAAFSGTPFRHSLDRTPLEEYLGLPSVPRTIESARDRSIQEAKQHIKPVDSILPPSPRA